MSRTQTMLVAITRRHFGLRYAEIDAEYHEKCCVSSGKRFRELIGQLS